MSELKIITNNQPRDLLVWEDLTAQEQKELGWKEDPMNSGLEFFRYRGNVYSLSEFMRIDCNSPFPIKWEAYYSDSFFSGILIRLVEDGERVICALYLS